MIVSKIFSRETLRVFEDASANIPLRPLDRAFERAHLRLGKDSEDGAGGARRTQFRRYVAGIDQHDPHQRDRLGAALGALVAESATSKQAYLVTAAERDGFRFTDGIFVPADTRPQSFSVTSVEDLASIDDRARRLQLLAIDAPHDAIRGARELVESLRRTICR